MVRFVAVQERVCSLDRRGLGSLVKWVEMLGDLLIAQKALADLQAAGGDRRWAGWREWSDAGEGSLVSGPSAGMTGVV